MRSRTILASVLALLLVIPAVAAEDPDLERLRGEISRLRRSLESVRAQQSTAERELQALDLELEILTRELRVASETAADMAAQREAALERAAMLARDLTRQKKVLSGRLATLYRLGNLSYLRLLLSVDETADPVRAVTMLSYLVTRDGRLVSQYRESRERLADETARIAANEITIARLRELSASRAAMIEKKRNEKNALLTSLRSESASSERRLVVLEEKARRLERLMELLYSRQPADAPQGNIASFKGALPWPVKGKLLEKFGRQRSARFATYTQNNGIRIAAEAGTDVRAVFNGTVLFSQWFRGYGNLVIIDHGDRVFSLYGNTRGSALSVGSRVTAGQVVAKVDTGEEGAAFLYFEMREDNKPADPQKWLR